MRETHVMFVVDCFPQAENYEFCTKQIVFHFDTKLLKTFKQPRWRPAMQTEKDLKRLFPIESWNKLHLQIIFYGREHCTARGCDGTVCKLCREIYPRRRAAVRTKKP